MIIMGDLENLELNLDKCCVGIFEYSVLTSGSDIDYGFSLSCEQKPYVYYLSYSYYTDFDGIINQPCLLSICTQHLYFYSKDNLKRLFGTKNELDNKIIYNRSHDDLLCDRYYYNELYLLKDKISRIRMFK